MLSVNQEILLNVTCLSCVSQFHWSKVLVGVAGSENLILVIFNLEVRSNENSVAELMFSVIKYIQYMYPNSTMC